MMHHAKAESLDLTSIQPPESKSCRRDNLRVGLLFGLKPVWIPPPIRPGYAEKR